MNKLIALIAGTFVLAVLSVALSAQTGAKNPNFDADLAKKLGADQRGMKNYVMVILKTGPTKPPTGDEGKELFKGHFANINRLAKERKLVVAGPFGDEGSDWEGVFVFDVPTVDEAKALTATDPTIKSGVFVAEYHKLYCTAALMDIMRIHGLITPTLP